MSLAISYIKHWDVSPKKLNKIAEQVLGYVQIFAIFLISKVKYIQYFLQENIYDENLPPVDYKELLVHLPHPESYKPGHIITFCRRRWEVIVPVFDFSRGEILAEKIESPTRLLFGDRKDTVQVGYGRIIIVKIH
ncbi:hypothetical protein F5B21DRAFT_508909 [Xylaria acuta]|nr:hypothetical protein F5B21DRAFT_508909 [Xylaria acuta]